MPGRMEFQFMLPKSAPTPKPRDTDAPLRILIMADFSGRSHQSSPAACAELANRPLLAVVSRLTEQKGLDLFLEVAARVLDLPAQIAVLGSGAHALEHGWTAFARRHPGRCAVRIGFDEGFAHRIEAGADIFVMPSRFEPCGLNQMYSLRYGTPPVVRATGGLADTVVDATDEKRGNGFVFGPATAAALFAALQRAAVAWRDPTLWRRLQKHGMARDSSWAEAAGHYAALYEKIAG